MYFVIETTSFAAVLAAGGVAIGMAWSGLMANFAAGAFMIILRLGAGLTKKGSGAWLRGCGRFSDARLR